MPSRLNSTFVLSLLIAAAMIAFALLDRSDIIAQKSTDAVFWMLLGLAVGIVGRSGSSRPAEC